jgi:hypothetical protein
MRDFVQKTKFLVGQVLTTRKGFVVAHRQGIFLLQSFLRPLFATAWL